MLIINESFEEFREECCSYDEDMYNQCYNENNKNLVDEKNIRPKCSCKTCPRIKEEILL